MHQLCKHGIKIKHTMRPDDVQHQLQCFLGFIPCSIKGGLNSR